MYHMIFKIITAERVRLCTLLGEYKLSSKYHYKKRTVVQSVHRKPTLSVEERVRRRGLKSLLPQPSCMAFNTTSRPTTISRRRRTRIRFHIDGWWTVFPPQRINISQVHNKFVCLHRDFSMLAFGFHEQ